MDQIKMINVIIAGATSHNIFDTVKLLNKLDPSVHIIAVVDQEYLWSYPITDTTIHVYTTYKEYDYKEMCVIPALYIEKECMIKFLTHVDSVIRSQYYSSGKEWLIKERK